MYTREVLEQGRLLVLQASGVLTGEELVATTRGMVEDGPSVSKVDTVLVLLDDVTQLQVGADHVRMVVDLDRRLVEYIPRAIVAIVASRDEVYGMARMWEMMVGFPGWKIEVFRSRADADEWIAGNRPAPT
jgi:hypothetical protein